LVGGPAADRFVLDLDVTWLSARKKSPDQDQRGGR
jgi:hypothetical protein